MSSANLFDDSGSYNPQTLTPDLHTYGAEICKHFMSVLLDNKPTKADMDTESKSPKKKSKLLSVDSKQLEDRNITVIIFDLTVQHKKIPIEINKSSDDMVSTDEPADSKNKEQTELIPIISHEEWSYNMTSRSKNILDGLNGNNLFIMGFHMDDSSDVLFVEKIFRRSEINMSVLLQHLIRLYGDVILRKSISQSKMEILLQTVGIGLDYQKWIPRNKSYTTKFIHGNPE